MYAMHLTPARRRGLKGPRARKVLLELVASGTLVGILSILGYQGALYLESVVQWLYDAEVYWLEQQRAAQQALDEANDKLREIADAKRQAEQEQADAAARGDDGSF